MFYKDAEEIYRVEELDRLPWLVHGFATRNADLPDRFSTLKQVHSSACVYAGGRTGKLQEGDALLEDIPGTQVAIRTADCVPILLADERRHVIAAVHAGWRGTAAQIGPGAVAAMRRRFSTEPADLHAALGPAIGPCCYEVGPEVAHHFGKEGRIHLDLAEINRRQLIDAGLRPEWICLAGLCTRCRVNEFHSYRRDGEAAGRMYSFAGIRQAIQ